MTAQDPGAGEEPRIEAVFRNGSITAFGVIVSFSIGFLSQWASRTAPWQLYDTMPAAAIILGVVLQTRALSLLLPVEGLRKSVYDRATRVFLIGLLLTGAGVFAAVALDVLAALLHQA